MDKIGLRSTARQWVIHGERSRNSRRRREKTPATHGAMRRPVKSVELREGERGESASGAARRTDSCLLHFLISMIAKLHWSAVGAVSFSVRVWPAAVVAAFAARTHIVALGDRNSWIFV
jgi:hypothetical protein